ncbi:MAG: riboflavin synthase [Candidatus Omnitrophica bacterium]|nr:riboflavin synthase [Candidatus Omnitrophota bacterium]
MFTGIIQNKGKVIFRRSQGATVRFAFRFQRKERKINLGESIAVNGVCLTVTRKRTNGFEVDAVPETLQATTLGALKPGDWVNLERSLRYGDLIGGHFVTGHVDARIRITGIAKEGQYQTLWMELPKRLSKMVAAKGSVALDGISLTVQALRANRFKIAVIPHTLTETTLGLKQKGDFLNFEVDMAMRYLCGRRKPYRPPASDKKLVAFLKSQGF